MNDEALTRTRYSLLKRMENWQDQESWQTFFDTYWRFIYGRARKAGLCEDESKEVLQETIITVSKSIHKFRRKPEGGSFKAWLMHTTHWRIQDQFRKRMRTRSASGNGDYDRGPRTDVIERIPDDSIGSMEAEWESDWEQNILEAALSRIRRKLDPAKYQIFDLHVLQKWPVTKVSSKLGVTINQVYSIKYRVSDMLKKEIGRLKASTV